MIFIGWGLGVFVTRLAGTIQDITGSLNYAFYLSGALLVAGVILAQMTKRPQHVDEATGEEVTA
jgi:OFA family oxalate/formate antiporter-like MFS transporter